MQENAGNTTNDTSNESLAPAASGNDADNRRMLAILIAYTVFVIAAGMALSSLVL